MYTSKYWWEVIGEEGDYIRFRRKGHYIRVHMDKILAWSEPHIGEFGRIQRFDDSDEPIFMVLYKADFDYIKPDPQAIIDNAYNRWRKLMGR